MSKATKKKHVAREVLEDLVVPNDKQQIVKVVGGRGNNLHEVQSANGETFLCSMPTKFRRNVWIKRGDYVIVESIAEGHKVTAEIVYILYPIQIKHLQEQRLWPVNFDTPSGCKPTKTDESKEVLHSTTQGEDDDSDNDDDLFVNTNHPPPIEVQDTTSTDSDS